MVLGAGVLVVDTVCSNAWVDPFRAVTREGETLSCLPVSSRNCWGSFPWALGWRAFDRDVGRAPCEWMHGHVAAWDSLNRNWDDERLIFDDAIEAMGNAGFGVLKGEFRTLALDGRKGSPRT